MGKKRKILRYSLGLRERARYYRNNMTDCEKLVWEKIKNKKILSLDFDRQRPIDKFIVDFYCKDLMLAIEIDGGIHLKEECRSRDSARHAHLESLGVRFLRFTNEEIQTDINKVIDSIKDWIVENGRELPGVISESTLSQSQTPPPAPPKGGVMILEIS